MHILRVSGYKTMPWKNGGGETTEILIFPPNASLDTFDWRISMARVDCGGPFSAFPGIDRTICIISGSGAVLDFEDAAPIQLTNASGPMSFSGDDAVFCSLVDGAIQDINIMTRRGRFKHNARCISISQAEQWTRVGDVLIFIVINGELEVRVDSDIVSLNEKDGAMLLRETSGVVTALPRGDVDVALIDIAASADGLTGLTG